MKVGVDETAKITKWTNITNNSYIYKLVFLYYPAQVLKFNLIYIRRPWSGPYRTLQFNWTIQLVDKYCDMDLNINC